MYVLPNTNQHFGNRLLMGIKINCWKQTITRIHEILGKEKTKKACNAQKLVSQKERHNKVKNTDEQ